MTSTNNLLRRIDALLVQTQPMGWSKRQVYDGNGGMRRVRKGERQTVNPEPVHVDREKTLAQIFLDAIAAMLASPLLQYTRLVKTLDTPVGYLDVNDKMPWDIFEMEFRRAERLLVEQLADAGNRENENLSLNVFDHRDPNVLIYGARHAADMVTHITEEQRRLLRTLIVQSHNNGWPPETLARDIRNSIGLTPKWSGAVVKYHRGMLDRGVHPSFAAKNAKAYRDRLLKSRAMMIARTEIMRAENEGKVVGWRQAIANGLLTGGGNKKWVTAPTNVCPVCLPMNGTEVGLDDTFILHTAQRRLYHVSVPPAHPHCRCTITYVPPRTEDLFADLGMTMEQIMAEITGDPRKP